MNHSCHVFYFSFQWNIKGHENQEFSGQTDFNKLEIRETFWKRVSKADKESDRRVLYNEKNYFYEFVHPVLYDSEKKDTIVLHFERIETQKKRDVSYIIELPDKTIYELLLDAVNLNLYQTGIGILSFHIINNRYADKNDILNINQYGRRLFPPFYADIDIENRVETPRRIEIRGLEGDYREDFSGYDSSSIKKPASFISQMIKECIGNIDFKPVIDDRMFTLSWFRNGELAKQFHSDETTDLEKFQQGDFWYRYVFIDGGESKTCYNAEKEADLLKMSTYARWAGQGSLYGISRYSMVMLSDAGEEMEWLFQTFQTVYARMAELCIVERASVLRFSGEITKITCHNDKEKTLHKKTNSLYLHYIKFINQVYFREVTAQEQGMEMYNMLYDQMCLKEYTEKLDNEIEELYNFVSLQEDRETNNTMSVLTKVATLFVPATFVAGVLGMNVDFPFPTNFWVVLAISVAISVLVYVLWLVCKKRKNRN